MNCRNAVDLILTTDPDELRVGAHGDLAAHLRACDQCRTAAEQVLRETELLGAAFGAAAPSVPAALAARQALELARHRRSRRRWLVSVPLAAAAALAAVVVASRAPRRLPTAPLQGSHGTRLNERPLVSAPPNANVAVLHTDNPDIVVIWFF